MSASARAFDIAVIGGGPAGIMAAVAARRHGASVVLLDENPAAGGQVYRATPATFARHGAATAEEIAGDRLRGLLSRSGAVTMFGYKAWSVSS